jgi:hypothetical protein
MVYLQSILLYPSHSFAIASGSRHTAESRLAKLMTCLLVVLPKQSLHRCHIASHVLHRVTRHVMDHIRPALAAFAGSAGSIANRSIREALRHAYIP